MKELFPFLTQQISSKRGWGKETKLFFHHLQLLILGGIGLFVTTNPAEQFFLID